MSVNSHELNSRLPKQIDRLIQALSGVRSLSNIEIKKYLEDELYQHILKSVLSYVDLDSCSVFLYKDGQFKCAAGLSWSDQSNKTILRLYTSNITFKLGEGILGLCAEQRTLIHCQDSATDTNFIPAENDRNNIGSLISSPLISCNELIGVINIAHPYPNFFEPWHEKIMATYANIIAQLIHNHRLIHHMETEVHTQIRELKTALKESDTLRKRYQELSFIDYLTEIYNRRYFFPEFSSAIANAQRNANELSLLILDLDSFKMINDNYGHELGDSVLIGISQLLKKQIRKGDILARLGGEEFAIALVGTDLHSANQFADRIRIMINELSWLSNYEKVKISTSIGLSSLKKLKSNSDEAVRIMMSEADMALYYCKENGRNQIANYEDLESIGDCRSIG